MCIRDRSYTSDTGTIVYDEWVELRFLIDLDNNTVEEYYNCLLYTSDAANDLLCVDLGGRRIIKKKKERKRVHA